MRPFLRLVLIAMPLLPAVADAGAATITKLDISRQGDAYIVEFGALVDAPAKEVYRVLSDHALLAKLSPAITSVQVQPRSANGMLRVRYVLRGCVLFFCKEAVEVDEVTRSDESGITARLIPEQSDFRSGSYTWRIRAAGDRTEVGYHATRTAGFWVPPLIGPWIIERNIRSHLEVAVDRLEALASGKELPSGSGRH